MVRLENQDNSIAAPATVGEAKRHRSHCALHGKATLKWWIEFHPSQARRPARSFFTAIHRAGDVM